MPFDRITIFCFGASYAVALLLELVQLFRPIKVVQWSRVGFTGAGLLAHGLFLAVQKPSLASQYGSLLFLSWILAVFYLYGSVHHRGQAWGVFVLPLVLGLVVLASILLNWGSSLGTGPSTRAGDGESWGYVWGIVHAALLMLSAVGVCVGFVASVMYLVQARRLRAKVPPGTGLRMLSLERLEEMNRRAINLTFPLLTAGVLVGAALLLQNGGPRGGWSDPKVLSAIVLWVVFALLLYLRYGLHLSGRRLAVLTIVAFALLIVTLVTPSHHFGSE